jgi:hypothetical protein
VAPSRPAATAIEGAEGVLPALELLALGSGVVLVAVLLGRLPSWRGELGTFQALFTIGFLFYALALARARRYRGARHATGIVIAVATAARLALLASPPSLSDDLYRYVWEGRVAAHGLDPYRLAPQAVSLAPLRDGAVFPRINHPELATLYPPLAIAGFALVSALSPTVLAMKLWVMLHDLALCLLLLAWLKRRGGDPVEAIAYAWCPLVLVEFAGSGHSDPTAMVWLVAALMICRERPLLSATALAAGVLTKLVPLLALPFLFRLWPARARALALGLLLAGLGVYLWLARGADSGLVAYARSWRHNELAFHYLESWLADGIRARWMAAAMVALAIGILLARGATPESGTRAGARMALLLSPVVHPWYLGWTMAFEPLRPSAPWVLLSLTVVLSYGAFAPPAAGAGFHPPLSWRWLEYGLPLALAAVLGLRRRARAAHLSE